ncbi:MAG: carboxypeptidase-like regulatory domain-containing protein, partial [Candidatus Cybelea sp.]
MCGRCRPRWSLFVLALIIGCVVAAPRAFAGTTGSITGTVTRVGGGPIAGARVTATSPSQTLTATTDASGRFSMLSLAPDTYTISVSKDGFEPSTTTGISVFADQ